MQSAVSWLSAGWRCFVLRLGMWYGQLLQFFGSSQLATKISDCLDRRCGRRETEKTSSSTMFNTFRISQC